MKINAENISALVDGQLHGAELAHALTAVSSDERWRETWKTYHLVGDVLRRQEPLPLGNADSDAFMTRLRQKLQREEMGQAKPVKAEAANDETFRWKWVAGLASMAAVAVMVWNAGAASNQGAMLAAQSQSSNLMAASVNGAASQVMLRDPRLDELLAAHRQVGSNSALPAPAGFLRNATFEGGRH